MASEIDYLLSLEAVRERANIVFGLAERGTLNHFNYHAERLSDAAEFVIQVISRDFGPDRYGEIPPHGRWQHFDVGGVDRVSRLIRGIQDKAEQTRVLIDLFFVSVLLDAGAGDVWQFKEPQSDFTCGRSEGIALASLYMFEAGVFSSNPDAPLSVDARALVNLSKATFESYFQISSSNPMVGVDARLQLLRDVGTSMLASQDLLGSDGRPGRIVDCVLGSAQGNQAVDYRYLWTTLQRILIPAWPKSRTHVGGNPIGDAWPLKVLQDQLSEADRGCVGLSIQPFHKLTQWLAYSLTVPFTRLMGLSWTNMHLGTGLPEYRNGGLFVDMKVLTLKEDTLRQGQEASGQELPMFDATGDVIVEWRALTVALLDRLHRLVAKHFSEKGVELSMAQMLEAGSWKSGRELAALHRPATKSSPILIDGDGTLF